MSKILNLYQTLLKGRGRFIDEVFETEIYKAICPQLTIIDAGAYAGEFSFYCYPFAKKIYALEPDPRPYRIMAKRIQKFELGKIVKPFQIALSGKSGKRLFHNSGFGGSTLLMEEVEKGNNIEVQTFTLNDFMNKQKIKKVDILKIDIENAEKEVFEAPDFPLVANRIKMIIGEHGEGLKKLLKPLGFKLKKYKHGFIYKR